MHDTKMRSALLGCTREDADILASFLLGVILALAMVTLFASVSLLIGSRL